MTALLRPLAPLAVGAVGLVVKGEAKHSGAQTEGCFGELACGLAGRGGCDYRRDVLEPGTFSEWYVQKAEQSE